MSKKWRLLLVMAGLLLLLLLVGPFLVPVPALEETVPPAALADEDSQFIDADGLSVHYKERGQGEPGLVLLHGFAASVFTWREVLDQLADYGRVVAYDRPAFGLTERPVGDLQPNVYAPDYQPQLVVGLMDKLGMEEAVLVGNSAGGAVAIQTALDHPQRVRALILVDPAVYTSPGAPAPLRPLLNTPQADHLGPLFARQIQDWGYEFGRMAWHDPSGFTDEVWEGYRKPLRADNWDRALWQFTASSGYTGLAERLDRLAALKTLPVLVITGENDRIVPPEDSIRLAGELPNAELVVIPNCGHVPQEECPAEFMAAVDAFLQELESDG